MRPDYTIFTHRYFVHRIVTNFSIFVHPASASLTPTRTPLLRAHHLQPKYLFYYASIICFLIDHLFQILQAVPEILDLSVVEIRGICRVLLYIVSGADIDEDVRGARQAPGNVERGSQRDE